MKTKFVYDVIEIGGLSFTFDGNSKVTASNGTFDDPKPNAFSTVQISDCPGSTPTCREGCYVHGLQEHDPDLHRMYQCNSANLRTLLIDPLSMLNAVFYFSNWIKANCKEFRWNVSGDVFSKDFANMIRLIAEDCPEVTFWIYTRTFDFLPNLIGPDNLIVNLSADRDNWEEAIKAHVQYNCRICYYTVKPGDPKLELLPTGSVIFPDYGLRGRDLDDPTEHDWWKNRLDSSTRKMVCPVDFFGQSEEHRCGKCTECMKIYKGETL